MGTSGQDDRCAPKQPPVPDPARLALQDQINAIVRGHAKSLKQQRAELKAVDPAEFASPSPSKYLSDADLSSYANLVLSQATERNTPGRSPMASADGWGSSVEWTAWEDDFRPRQLTFADGDSW